LLGRGILVPVGAHALPKGIAAKAWIVADLDSGDILAARDPHGRYQPASILKTLTALVLLPQLPGNRMVTVTPAAAHAEGSAVGLLAGGRYSVDQLFQALFLVSGNDAAAALAEANGGVSRTVQQMNAKAADLGASDTVVQTASGLDGWQQLTSAYDLALILRAAVNEPRLVAYDRLRSASYPPKTSKYGHVGKYQFDNQGLSFLGSVPGALMAKSGFTDAARHTYLCAAKRNGHRLGIVFLRDERVPLDHWQQAAALFNWAFALPVGTKGIGAMGATPTTTGPLLTSSSAMLPPAANRTIAQPRGQRSGLHSNIVLTLIVGGVSLGCALAGGLQLLRRRQSLLR
jgi:D-alanyl-D-alanine carboxypeptidase (penicillin-binding protein 5/6)